MNRILRWWGSSGRFRATVRVGLAAGLLHAAAPLAWAARETSPPDTKHSWIQWGCLLLFLATCWVAFKNPKRTHMN
jgi:hypothetical protein